MAPRNLLFGGHRQNAMRSSSKDAGVDILRDCVSSCAVIFRKPLRERKEICAWYGPQANIFDGAHYGGERSESPRVVQNSRGAYMFQSDRRGKHLSDVFQYRSRSYTQTDDGEARKPVEWMKMLIATPF